MTAEPAGAAPATAHPGPDTQASGQAATNSHAATNGHAATTGSPHAWARAWGLRTGWRDNRGRGPVPDGRQSVLLLDAWRAAGAPEDLSAEPELPEWAQPSPRGFDLRLAGQPSPAAEPVKPRSPSETAERPPQCTATARSTGKQCRRRAEPGQDKCDKHNGSGQDQAQAQEGSDGHSIATSGRAGYSYVCGDCAECRESGRDRGLYVRGELAGPLPYVHARPIAGYGRAAEAGYLLSATAESGARRVMLGPREIDTGQWQHKLRMAWTADRYLLEAAASAIYRMAASTPEVPAAPPPGVITTAGMLPPVTPECLPEVGYWDRPPGVTEARRRQAMRTIARIGAANPNLALELGASAAGSFANVLGQRSAWWQTYGGSSIGKTTLMICVAALWGNPDETTGLLMSWDNTRKGTGRHLGDLGYLPAFFDESGMAEFKPSDWARAILGVGARRLQARLWGNGAQATAPWAGYAFASGNGRMSEGLAVGKFAGVAARIIELPGPFTRSAAESDRLKMLAHLGYGWLGPQILSTVSVATMRQCRNRALDVLGAPSEGPGRSIVEHLALACAGAAAIDDVFGLDGALWWSALAAAENYMASHPVQLSGDPELFLTALSDLIGSRPGTFPHLSALGQPGQERELFGVRDAEHVYLYQAGLTELISLSGVDQAVALAGLYQAGHLHVSDNRRKVNGWTMPAPRAAAVGGVRPQCYQIRLSALDNGADDDESGDGGGQAAPQGGPPDGGQGELPAGGPGLRACAVHAARRGFHSGCPDCRALNTLAGGAPAAAAAVTPVPVTGAGDETAARRADFVTEVMARHLKHRHAKWGQDQERALAARLELLDDPAIGDEPARLLLLEALEGKHDKSGPFAPTRKKVGRGGKSYRSALYWQPPLPADVINTAWVRPCPAFSRDYDGPVIRLDRNAAYLAATASVEVAHSKLEDTGPVDLSEPGALRPGYYLVDVHPWTETGLPSPLSGRRAGTRIWVPAPTAGLLAELARQGRWPDAGAAGSWTGAESVRLDSWAHFLAELRRYGLEFHGRGSDPYDAWKRAFGMARILMLGARGPAPMAPREWAMCKARRPDIPHHIEAQHAATMFRAADKALRAAGPELGPVSIGETDALIIPAAAWDAVTGGDEPAIRIDETTLELGSFKVKGGK